MVVKAENRPETDPNMYLKFDMTPSARGKIYQPELNRANAYEDNAKVDTSLQEMQHLLFDGRGRFCGR